MGENITFSDWSQKLENGTNHWLPAYGFQQPGNLQDRQFEILNGKLTPCFPLNFSLPPLISGSVM